MVGPSQVAGHTSRRSVSLDGADANGALYSRDHENVSLQASFNCDDRSAIGRPAPSSWLAATFVWTVATLHWRGLLIECLCFTPARLPLGRIFSWTRFKQIDFRFNIAALPSGAITKPGGKGFAAAFADWMSDLLRTIPSAAETILLAWRPFRWPPRGVRPPALPGRASSCRTAAMILS